MRSVKPYGHLNRLVVCTTQAKMPQAINMWSPEWDDDNIPRTDRPVRFYRAFTPGGNSRKYLYPSRIHA